MNNITIQNAPNNSVSETTQELTQQAKAIAATAELFQSDPSTERLRWLKSDCIELLRLISEKPKQSIFNVTNPSRCVMAENVTFSQAIRLRKSFKGKCLIKFAGMGVML